MIPFRKSTCLDNGFQTQYLPPSYSSNSQGFTKYLLMSNGHSENIYKTISPGSIISWNVLQNLFSPHSSRKKRLGWALLTFTFINLLWSPFTRETSKRVHRSVARISSPFYPDLSTIGCCCIHVCIEFCYCDAVMSAMCKMYLVFKVMCPSWADWSWMQVWQLNWLNFGTSSQRECQTFFALVLPHAMQKHNLLLYSVLFDGTCSTTQMLISCTIYWFSRSPISFFPSFFSALWIDHI